MTDARDETADTERLGVYARIIGVMARAMPDYVSDDVDAAIAIHAALRAAGWTITRTEPTERMKVAGRDEYSEQCRVFEESWQWEEQCAAAIFTAMLSASEEPQ